MILLSGLAVYLAQSIVGFFVMHLIWDVREIKALVFKFFLGIGMGAGLSSLFYFWWCWLYFPNRIYPFFVAFISIVLIVVIWRKEARQNWAGWQNVTLTSGIQKKILIWGTLLLTSVSLSVTNFWVRTIPIPHGFYDAWAIWNAGARFIYGNGTGWRQLFLQDPWSHTNYPLLVQLNVVIGWLFTGSSSTRIPLGFSLVMMLGLIGLVFSALLIARDFEQGALAAILFSSLPALALLGSFQYAELQLSFFILATGVLLYLYTTNANTRLLVLAGFFAGFAGWTKNEGQMFIILSSVVCLGLSLVEKKNLFKYYLAGLLLPTLTILVFKSVTLPTDLFVDAATSFSQLFDLSRYLLIFREIGEQFVSFGYWSVSFFVVLIVYTLLVWLRPVPAQGKRWLPLLLCLLQFGGYYIIYLITPYDLSWHLNTSLGRLIFQLLPLMLFWLFTLLRSPSDIFQEKLADTRA